MKNGIKTTYCPKRSRCDIVNGDLNCKQNLSTLRSLNLTRQPPIDLIRQAQKLK